MWWWYNWMLDGVAELPDPQKPQQTGWSLHNMQSFIKFWIYVEVVCIEGESSSSAMMKRDQRTKYWVPAMWGKCWENVDWLHLNMNFSHSCLKMHWQNEDSLTEYWFEDGLIKEKMLIYWQLVQEYLGKLLTNCGVGSFVGNMLTHCGMDVGNMLIFGPYFAHVFSVNLKERSTRNTAHPT